MSGFYGILDTRGMLRHGDFERQALPAPQLLSYGAWVGAAGGSAPFETVLATDEERWVAFHGALYNKAALELELDLPPTSSLDEILLRGWARWPNDWTGRLDGPCALAYWSADERRLVLRRDPSGLMGLFYGRTAHGQIAFASRLATMVRLPGVTRRISIRGLHEFLCLLDIAPPNTIYDSIRAVPAGEGVVLDAMQPNIEFMLPPRSIRPTDLHFDDAVAELDSHLSASIRSRLDGVSRPAAFLSGGVDSGLICALAARDRPDLHALTVGFARAQYDEAPAAARIAKHLGIGHTVLRFEHEQILRTITAAGKEAEQPMADPAEPVTLLAFDYARSHFDAVLDGTGADELVGAMPPRHVRIGVEYAARLPPVLRRWVKARLSCLPPFAGYVRIFDFEHPAELLMRWHGFRREEIETLTGAPFDYSSLRFVRVFDQFPADAHFERYSALLEAMPCDRLAQAALLTSLDVRLPLWSPAVEAHLRGLPRDYRWREDAPKRILRAALARHIPRALWDFPKHSFDFPLWDFLATDDYRVVRRYLLETDWTRWGFLDPDIVASYARRFVSGEAGVGFQVWALVVLAAWMEGHFDS